MSKMLFESDRERVQMTVISAAFILGGLVAAGRQGSEDELVYDAYKLARTFVRRGESLAVHGDFDKQTPADDFTPSVSSGGQAEGV
jgi:hypothetical protein